MSDIDVIKIVKDGFKLWKENLVMCVPFIWSSIIIGLSVFAVIIAFFFSFFGKFVEMFSSMSDPTHFSSSSSSYEFVSSIMSSINDVLFLIIGIIFALVIVILFVNSFFVAGAIGMSKRLILTGQTGTETMWEYGRRKMLSVLGADLIVGLLAMVGIIFLVPGLLMMFSSGLSLSGSSSSMVFGILILLFGLLIMLVYVVLVSIAFALVRYTVVMEDLSAIEGLKRGFQVFKKGNKINVFAMWVIILLITIPIALIQYIPFIGWILYFILSTIFLASLNVVWWGKLYIEITGIKV